MCRRNNNVWESSVDLSGVLWKFKSIDKYYPRRWKKKHAYIKIHYFRGLRSCLLHSTVLIHCTAIHVALSCYLAHGKCGSRTAQCWTDRHQSAAKFLFTVSHSSSNDSFFASVTVVKWTAVCAGLNTWSSLGLTLTSLSFPVLRCEGWLFCTSASVKSHLCSGSGGRVCASHFRLWLRLFIHFS